MYLALFLSVAVIIGLKANIIVPNIDDFSKTIDQLRNESDKRLSECLIGWDKIDGRCFKVPLRAESLSANDAAKRCADFGATLASSKSGNINKYLGQISMNRVPGSTYYIWIGGKADKTQGWQWVWADGTLVYDGYLHWNMHGPTGEGGMGGPCMIMYAEHWYGFGCERKHDDVLFACEKNAQPPLRI